MGILRLFLALAVIAGHSGTSVFGVPGIGAFLAVNFFFVISGFYMAMILNEKYTGPTPTLFYKSRLLRLLPTFLIGTVLGLLVSWNSLATTFADMAGPGRVFTIIENLFIVPQDLSYVLCIRMANGSCANPEAISANPPSWTLAVELGFYLVAPFLVRSVRRTFIFFAAGCIYLVSLNLVHFPITGVGFLAHLDPVQLNYNFYPSSFVYFGAGALAYQLSKNLARPIYLAAVIPFAVLCFATTYLSAWQLLIAALAVPILFEYTKSNRFDRLVGELSYPVYVLHWPIMVWISPLLAEHSRALGLLNKGTWVAILSILGALSIHFTLELAVNRYRWSDRFLRSPNVRPDRGRVRWGARILSAAYLIAPVAVFASIAIVQIA